MGRTASDIKCRKCGKSIADGAYLKRTNPKGELFEGECEPVCYTPWLSENAKVLHAIKGAGVNDE